MMKLKNVFLQSFHQMASLLRRDHSTVQSADLRGAMPQQPETYDLTTEKVRKYCAKFDPKYSQIYSNQIRLMLH